MFYRLIPCREIPGQSTAQALDAFLSAPTPPKEYKIEPMSTQRYPIAAPIPGQLNLRGEARDFRAPWKLFWAAFLIRVLYMTLAHTYRIRPYGDHFGFGWEMGRIARALVTGYGYADPFSGHTGPTAWVTPLYPLLIAAVFKLFGVFTLKSAWVLLAINCALSALIAGNTWEIAARCFNRKVANWAGWIWALYPAAMQYAVRWIWEMTLTALLFSSVLVLALRMRSIGNIPEGDGTEGAGGALTPSRWALFGLLWGLIALSNPSLLIFLPILGIWLLLEPHHLLQPQHRGWLRPDWPHQVRGVLLSAVVFLLCIAPWTIRNWRAFHQFVPLRGNFGAELYLGNGPGAVGLLMEYDHPFQAPDQLREYRQLGELTYARMRGDRAKAIIRSHPAHFAALTLKRIYYFWFSVPHPFDDAAFVEYGRNLNFAFTSLAGLFGLALALRRSRPAAGLFAWAFLTLPLLYYFVTVHARFRHPLEPLIAILGVYLFQSAVKRRKLVDGR